jgi:hypothetical protein
VSPTSSSAAALVGTDVTAVFSIDMNATTVESAFTLSLNSTPVPATVVYNAASKTATLTPAADLASDTEYRATIAASVEDTNGNTPLSTDYVWSFITSPAMLLVSKNANGVSSNDLTRNADIDSTGRYIVFESEASNLASVATTLNRQHIYRKDNVSGDVLLVSSDRTGLVEANTFASNPRISSNGRYVVFESTANNLDGNSNSNNQIYLKDLSNNAVSLISRNISGIPDNGFGGASNATVSDDGRYVLFQSSDREMSAIDGGGLAHIYLKDMSDGTVEMISRDAAGFRGDDASNNPDMSTDGTHIVFESLAKNFTASSNGFNNIYYVDTSVAHKVEQISVATGGAEANGSSGEPSISEDGSTIVFQSDATNLNNIDNDGIADIYLHYRPSGRTELLTVNPINNSESGDGASSNAQISGNAEYVVFKSLALNLASGATPGIESIFVRNLIAWPGTIIEKLDNPSSSLPSGKPAISTDGRYVSFHSAEKYSDDTDTLSDIFRVHNSTRP